MSNNNRIFFATHYVAICPMGVAPFTAAHALHGVQSVGMTTNFNLEQAFELGQLSLYQNIENIPDIEINITKVIDGYQLAYHSMTRGAASSTLAGRSTQRCMIGLAIFPDSYTAASGTPVDECIISGAYISAVSYEIPTEGNATETVTAVANNKVWDTVGNQLAGFFNGNDSPIANINIPGSGSVMRRQHVIFSMGSGITFDTNGAAQSIYQGYSWGTVLPRQIPGITSSGTNPYSSSLNAYAAHIGRIAVNANLGREALYELGHKAPYFRYVNFPVQVTCDIDVVASDGDSIGATEAGTLGNGNNLQNESIRISLQDGTFIDLGLKNKLQSVSYNGGDANGGNVTVTYSYLTFNDFTVTHPQQNS